MPVRVANASGTVTVQDTQSVSLVGTTTGFLASSTANQTYVLRRVQICRQTFTGTCIDFTGANANVTIEDITAKIDTNGGFPRVFLAVNDGALTLNRNTIERANNGFIEHLKLGETGTVVYTADNNHFVGLSGSPFRKDAVNYTTLPDWRTATGQDTNSDTVGDASSACAVS